MKHALIRSNEDRARTTYIQGITELLNRTFSVGLHESQAQDAKWRAWIDSVQGRESRNEFRLINFLGTDANDVFKARAIAILTCPNLQIGLFSWRPDSKMDTCCVSYLRDASGQSEPVAFGRFSPKLRAFTAEVLRINASLAYALYETNGEHARGIEHNVHYWGPLILDVVSVLPDDSIEAEALFKRYRLNDPVAFEGMDFVSGYNPLGDVFNKQKLPEKWKAEADRRMRAIIQSELAGQTEPRVDWEAALGCYISKICRAFFRKPFGYSAALLASQIEFILGLPIPADFQIFSTVYIKQVWEALQALKYRDLRHRLARHMLLEPKRDTFDRFFIHDDNSETAAAWMLEQFGDEDPEIRAQIAVLTEEFAKRKRQEAASHRRKVGKASADAALLDSMR